MVCAVISPKLVLVGVRLGVSNAGRLGALNASSRSARLIRSVMKNFLASEAFSALMPSARSS